MSQTTQTPMNFSNTNSILSTAPKANQSFSFASVKSVNPATYGVKSSFANTQAAQTPSLSQNAGLAKTIELTNPNYTKQDAKAAKQIQKENFKIQQNAIKQNLTPEQKGEKGRNAAGWALAGIDSAVNIANAGMSYANMAKQWNMMDKVWNASEHQRQIENARYEKREQERLDARDDARSAQNAVFSNRQWHDANAGDSSEGEPSENQNEGESKENTAFTRD